VRRLPAALLTCAWLALLAATPAAAAQAVPPPPPPPKAWIVVDAATGAVLDAGNAREPVRVASTIKLLTALIAVQRLDPDASVPVSDRAAAMPARKLNMGAGETWSLQDTLYSLLLSSANDAAAALGESVGGSLEDFVADMTAAGEALGLADSPVLRDPSGLDDESSIGGGNLVSARDVAVIARAALADPTVAGIVAAPDYRFTGPDGVPHHLINHNKLLARYPGAIGMKTGYTKRSGHTLVAAAERNGRQVIAVVLGADDMYGSAAHFLDKGFATAPTDAVGRLPAVRTLPAPTEELAAGGVGVTGAAVIEGDPIAAEASTTAFGPRARGLALRFVVNLATVVTILRTRVLLRQRARARRRRSRAARSGSPPRGEGQPLQRVG
jgi:D-alanyl-D-alanine carboxypeptidase (penicillin-binding protein 5/6)